MKIKFVFVCCLLILSSFLYAETSEFSNGPIFENYGINTTVKQTWPIPKQTKFKVVFDISEQSETGKVNQNINSLARFINMHVRSGIKLNDINLALVVHGSALNDFLTQKRYKEKFDTDNNNEELISLLIKQNVQIIVCGQSAAYQKLQNEDFLPEMTVALSAMTAHAVLQQQGYTLNPF
ncbi:MAG: DsrE family protein [Gammaproteobacteria bacterium]|nr:DsrE family protein [Gammaproteobacteria bacterium]